mgnify:CR=1 FL=1
MPRIKFVTEYTVEAADGVTHEIGSEMECSRQSANHFISKGVAVQVEDKPKKVAKPAEKKSETGGLSQQAQASPKQTPKKRGRPPKAKVEESSSSTTTTDTQD